MARISKWKIYQWWPQFSTIFKYKWSRSLCCQALHTDNIVLHLYLCFFVKNNPFIFPHASPLSMPAFYSSSTPSSSAVPPSASTVPPSSSVVPPSASTVPSMDHHPPCSNTPHHHRHPVVEFSTILSFFAIPPPPPSNLPPSAAGLLSMEKIETWH